MQDHIRVGREYPQVDNHTTYSLRPRRPGVRRRLRHRRRRRLPRPRPAPAHDRGVGLHAARHAELHLHRRLRRARAERARRRARCPRPPASPPRHEPPRLRRGPRHHGHRRRARWACRRPSGPACARPARASSTRCPSSAASSRRSIRRSGSSTCPATRKILAKDLVELHRQQTLEQFDVPVHLETTAESISWEDGPSSSCTPTRGDLRSRTVIVAGGHGAFEPKKLPDYDMTPWEGRGAHYLVGSKSEFEGKRVVIIGGGDSACDWVVNLLDTAERVSLVHRREGFRAHEATVKEVMDAHADGPHRPPRALPGRATSWATARSRACSSSTPRTPSSVVEVPCDAILLQLGFKTALGPLKEWGFEIEKGAIQVDGLFQTSLDRVWACGDITTFDGKLKLIATGYAEAAIAVAQAVHHIRPEMKIQPKYSTNTGVPGRRRGPGIDALGATCARPTRCSRGCSTSAASPERAPAAAATSYARARARDRRPAALGARGARDLRAPARALRRPAADARSRSWPTSPTSCASPSASRAPRRPTCARWPSTSLSGELELDRLQELSDEEVMAELVAVKGIGDVERAHLPDVHRSAGPTSSPSATSASAARSSAPTASPALPAAAEVDGARRAVAPAPHGGLPAAVAARWTTRRRERARSARRAATSSRRWSTSSARPARSSRRSGCRRSPATTRARSPSSSRSGPPGARGWRSTPTTAPSPT